jgi:hypothetical protein
MPVNKPYPFTTLSLRRGQGEVFLKVYHVFILFR